MSISYKMGPGNSDSDRKCFHTQKRISYFVHNSRSSYDYHIKYRKQRTGRYGAVRYSG